MKSYPWHFEREKLTTTMGKETAEKISLPPPKIDLRAKA